MSNIYSRSEGDTTVYDCRCREVDTIVVSPVLEFTDSIVERIFDSIVQEDKINKYHNDSNFFMVIFRENRNINVLDMYIEISDYIDVLDDSLPYNYGCMYYCDRLFVIHGYDASLFFNRTGVFEKLNIKYVFTYDFPMIEEPIMWWTFSYYKGMWYDIDYDFYKHQWQYYNYNNNEVKWLDSE